MGGALLAPLVLPYINTSEVRLSAFRPVFRQFYWLFVVDCLILGWIGQKPVEYPYIEVGQVGTAYYFLFLLAIIPAAGLIEGVLMRWDTESSDRSVKAGAGGFPLDLAAKASKEGEAQLKRVAPSL